MQKNMEKTHINNNSIFNLPVPLLFPPNLLSVFRLSIIPNLPSSIIPNFPSNPPYYITIILIMSSDKDISPNTIIAPDKASALILIIVLDRATLQPLL